MAVVEVPEELNLAAGPRGDRRAPSPIASASCGATVASPGRRSPTALAGSPPCSRRRASGRHRRSGRLRAPGSRRTTTSPSTSTTATSTSRGCSAPPRRGAVGVNVNYRYVADELRYVLADCRARAVVYHGTFAATLAEVLPDLPDVRLLLQVDDGSGADLLPGPSPYEEALAAADARRRRPGCRPTTSTSSTPAARRGCPRACSGARPTSSPPASAWRAPPTSWWRRRQERQPPRAPRPAVHARRRPLERHQRVDRRRHGRDPGRPRPARPRRRPRHRRAERVVVPAHRGRRLRPPARRRARRPGPAASSASASSSPAAPSCRPP